MPSPFARQRILRLTFLFFNLTIMNIRIKEPRFSARNKKEKLPVGKTGIMARDKRKKRLVFGFETVRWIVMILSFALLIFGGRLFGTVFTNIHLPVFACPYNLDQLTNAGCFYFSHLDVLFQEGWQEILAFFGTFIVCAVLLGRVLCGFVCPLGFIQDVAHEARQALHIEGIALNEKLYAVLRLVKWVMLIIFLGIGFVGGNFCDFCPAAAVSPALAGFKLSLGLSGFIMVVVLVSGFSSAVASATFVRWALFSDSRTSSRCSS